MNIGQPLDNPNKDCTVVLASLQLLNRTAMYAPKECTPCLWWYAYKNMQELAVRRVGWYVCTFPRVYSALGVHEDAHTHAHTSQAYRQADRASLSSGEKLGQRLRQAAV